MKRFLWIQMMSNQCSEKLNKKCKKYKRISRIKIKKRGKVIKSLTLSKKWKTIVEINLNMATPTLTSKSTSYWSRVSRKCLPYWSSTTNWPSTGTSSWTLEVCWTLTWSTSWCTWTRSDGHTRWSWSGWRLPLWRRLGRCSSLTTISWRVSSRRRSSMLWLSSIRLAKSSIMPKKTWNFTKPVWSSKKRQ